MMYIHNITYDTDAISDYIPYVPTGQWRLDTSLYTKNNESIKDHMITIRLFFDIKLGRLN